MGKRRLLPLDGQESKTLFTASPTEEIVYVVPKEDIEVWIADNRSKVIDNLAELEDDTILIPLEENLILLGIQFEFQIEDDDEIESRENILISQLYFDTQHTAFFRFDELNDSEKVVLPNHYLHKILAVRQGVGTIFELGAPLYYTVSKTPHNFSMETKMYQRFTLYENSTGMSGNDTHLVYFSKDDVELLAKYYKKVVISGSRMQPGKNLVHRPENREMFRESYFTLKMEGMEFDEALLTDSSSLTGQSTPTAALAAPEVMGPGFFDGLACPPDWDFMGGIITQIIQNPQTNVNAFVLQKLGPILKSHVSSPVTAFKKQDFGM